MRSLRNKPHRKRRAVNTSLALILIVVASLPAQQPSSSVFGQERVPRRIIVAPRTAKPPDREPASLGGIALGYAVFVADPKGQPVQTSTDRVLTNGERIRIAIESSSDGCLYVFDQEGDGPARLVFPNLRIRRGSAHLDAGVPLNLPGAMHGGDLDWFNLSVSAPNERLIMVFSQTPVEGWPSERRLADHPSGFKISRQELERMTSESLSEAKEESHLGNGRPPSSEPPGLARGPKISRKEASPSVVVTAPPGARCVVAYVELRTRK